MYPPLNTVLFEGQSGLNADAYPSWNLNYGSSHCVQLVYVQLDYNIIYANRPSLFSIFPFWFHEAISNL